MASDLFKSINHNMQPPQTQQAQNPRDAALNLLRQQGFQIPNGQENDPNALLKMVLQSGRIPQNRLPMAQNALMQMIGRR
jgi:hypothetical protein